MMTRPTEAAVDTAFARHAMPIFTLDEQGKVRPTQEPHWFHFGDKRRPHRQARARQIVKLCLALGTPVTDVVTTETFAAIVDELLNLRERVADLESGRWVPPRD